MPEPKGFEDGRATGAGKKKRCDYGIPKRFACTLSTAQEILKSVKERDATNAQWTGEIEWSQTATIPLECDAIRKLLDGGKLFVAARGKLLKPIVPTNLHCGLKGVEIHLEWHLRSIWLQFNMLRGHHNKTLGLTARYCSLWSDLLRQEKLRQHTIVVSSPPAAPTWYPPFLERSQGGVMVPDRADDMPVVMWLAIGPSDKQSNTASTKRQAPTPSNEGMQWKSGTWSTWSSNTEWQSRPRSSNTDWQSGSYGNHRWY